MRIELTCEPITASLTAAAALALVLAAGPAFAQPVGRGCTDPQTRADMERCLGSHEGISGGGLISEDAAPGARHKPSGHRKVLQGALDLSIRFASGSAMLDAGARAKLAPLGELLADPRHATDRYRIEGHADTVGPADDNVQLSRRRAQSVADYLQSDFHVEPARIEVSGVGESQLVVPTPDNTAEPRNRVVRIIQLGV